MCVCRTGRVPPLPNLASFLVPPGCRDGIAWPARGGFCAPDFFSLSLIILDVLLLLLRDAAARRSARWRSPFALVGNRHSRPPRMHTRCVSTYYYALLLASSMYRMHTQPLNPAYTV